MKIEEAKSVIESMLFAAGRVVTVSELAKILEKSPEEIDAIVQSLKDDYMNNERGIEVLKVDDGYELATKREYYDYVVQLFDNRSKPSLSTAALEVLSIIAYNPQITRAEIEAIRGVNSDGSMYRLMEYNLIEEAGKLDIPGKPISYRTTQNFLKMFGLSSLDELPELPRYRIDENEQIVIDDLDNQEHKNSEERDVDE